jgi:hypothetical protein
MAAQNEASRAAKMALMALPGFLQLLTEDLESSPASPEREEKLEAVKALAIMPRESALTMLCANLKSTLNRQLRHFILFAETMYDPNSATPADLMGAVRRVASLISPADAMLAQAASLPDDKFMRYIRYLSFFVTYIGL